MNVQDIFKECSEVVNSTFPLADESERLRATLGMVELTMRGVAEELNRKRWENAQVPTTGERG